MSRYTITPEARRDLKSIYRYVGNRSVHAAARLNDLFFERFRMLSAHPLLGEARPDLGDELRLFTAGNYVILYRPKAAGISVVHVVHAARDIAALWHKPE